MGEEFSLKKHLIKSGIILGITLVVLKVLIYLFGVNGNKFSEIVILFVFIFSINGSLRRFRIQVLEEKLKKRVLVKYGGIIAAIASIPYAIVIYLEHAHWAPNLLDEARALTEEFVATRPLPDEPVANELLSKQIDFMITAGFMSFASIIRMILGGLFVSLLFAGNIYLEKKLLSKYKSDK